MSRNPSRTAAAALLAFGAGAAWLGAPARAADGGNVEPYIDQLREGMEADHTALPPTRTEPDPFIQSVKQKLGPAEEKGGYIEHLKATDPDAREKPEGSFVDQEKSKLEPKKEGGAIADFQAGRSELKQNKSGDIHHAFGFRLGATSTRAITAGSGTSSKNFFDVYQDKWTPDLTLFYEFQPFHSEWLGNVGVVFSGGMSYFDGFGVFEFNLTNPVDHVTKFGSTSQTRFKFISLPVMAGLNYRFNLLRILRPYVQAGPTIIGFVESRSDAGSWNRGNSRGLILSGGVNLLMDWIDPKSGWNLYEEQGIKHYYLTLDYSRMSTLGGDVSFTISGLSLGMTFEF